MKNVILPAILFFVLCNLKGLPGQDMAIELDGIDDYLEVFDSASLDLNGPLTISCWYYYS
jgi:hypothetical protein